MLQGKTDFNVPIRPKIQHDIMLRSYQRSAIKPTTRQDGSPLVIGDLWRNTSIPDLFDWEWNGLYWVSPIMEYSSKYNQYPTPPSNGLVQSYILTNDLIPLRPGYDVLVDSMTLSLFSPLATNTSFYFYGVYSVYQTALDQYQPDVNIYTIQNLLASKWTTYHYNINRVINRNGFDLTFILLNIYLKIPASGYAGISVFYMFNFATRLIHP